MSRKSETAKRIRAAREERDLTQAELSRMSKPYGGITASAIGNYELGIRTPDPQSANILEKVFGLPAAYWMGIIDKKEALLLTSNKDGYAEQFNTPTIFDRIVEARRDCGLPITQDEIGKDLGVGQTAVSKWKLRESSPTLNNVVEIADQTGVCVEWLFTGRGPKEVLNSQLLEAIRGLSPGASEEVLRFAEFRRQFDSDQGSTLQNELRDHAEILAGLRPSDRDDVFRFAQALTKIDRGDKKK